MQATDFIDDPRIAQLTAAMHKACAGKHFSDIVDDAGNQYIDLVMEGGGVLGIALVGYSFMLEQAGIRFLGIGGTSAGSINALLLAALAVPAEIKSAAMLQLLANADFASFVDGDEDVREFVEAMVSGAGKLKLAMKGAQVIDTLERDLGLSPGEAFREWLSQALQTAGIATVGDLKARMRRLPRSLRKRGGEPLTPTQANPYLAIIAADITTETKAEFPKMASMYWPKPDDIDPSWFVRASMSVPLFFAPLVIDHIPQGPTAKKNWARWASYRGEIPRRCLLVDGGTMSNFPIDIFHDPAHTPIAPTFGVKLGSERRRCERIESPLKLVQAIHDSARHTLDYDFLLRHPDYRNLMTWIDTGDHHWLNFNLSDEDKKDLFIRGAQAAKEFLCAFDWPAYKKLRGRIAKTYV